MNTVPLITKVFLVLTGILAIVQMGTAAISPSDQTTEADGMGIIMPLQMVPEHSAITEYQGPQTCLACHEAQALGMHGSVHYQWTGPTPNVPNIAGNAGKGDLGFNTYCGTVVTSRRVACWSCHVGNGRIPKPEVTFEQLNNIDCLMCHHEQYARKAMPPSPRGDFNTDFVVNFPDYARLSQYWLHTDCTVLDGCGGGTDLDNDGSVTLSDISELAAQWLAEGLFETFTMTDYQGLPHTWTLPAEDAEGNFQYVPNEAAMALDILQVAQTVHKPTRGTCLRCHAYAAGTDCGKRGDLGSDTVNPPVDVDVHMSVDGQNFTCQQCHTFQNHRVLGRGLDLRANDHPELLTCTSGGCHTTNPHDSNRLNLHTARVACQSCHIPRFAKQMTTELARDWNHPFWAQGLFGGQGGYKPEEIRAMNVTPSYRWYDGTSNVYALGLALTVQNATGQYEMGTPNGSVNSPGAKIMPMKEHISNSARHDATGQLIPHSTSTYFFTGEFSRAVQEGMDQTSLTGSWTMVDVHTFQTINHGVEPTANALACGQCHASLLGGPTRLDLQGTLGYQLKGTIQQVCIQCHNFKSPRGFSTEHDKHVDDKNFDCSWCHNFTRPERGLILP